MSVKPYFDDGTIAIYHGDCREILPSISADVMVSDPPYGMAYQSGWKESSRIANDNSTECRDAALEIWGGQAGADLWSVVRSSPGRCSRIAHLGQGRLAWYGRSVAAVGTLDGGNLRAR